MKYTYNKNRAAEAAETFSNYSGHAVIMWNWNDGDVWTDEFVSDTDWNVYHSTTIVGIYAKGGLHGRNERISSAQLYAALDALCKYRMDEMDAELIQSVVLNAMW